MKPAGNSSCFIILTLAMLLCLLPGAGIANDETVDLGGLWKAKRRFGPDVQGKLIINKNGDRWTADIAGYSAAVILEQNTIRFSLPQGRGSFIGKSTNSDIIGHWIQPPMATTGQSYASPVFLRSAGQNRWEGNILPLAEEFTLFLKIGKKSDGSTSVFLRNPERNIGVFLKPDSMRFANNTLTLLRSQGDGKPEKVVAESPFHADDETFTFYIGNRGGSYDFHRVDEDAWSEFYPRGKNPGAYVYSAPPSLDDGWPTGSLQEAGIDPEPIKKLIETIIQVPPQNVSAPYIHGFLLARKGKLVLEEYFHGFHRDRPHDSRSASKSLTSILVGAAIQQGMPLSASTSVYDVINGKPPQDLDERKKKMTVEHLLTMSSGFHCDDSDPSTPGHEDVMQEQEEELDWYRYARNLPMIRQPGEKAVYCSGSSNLLGNVLSSATGLTLPDLFQELIARPLNIQHYYLNLQPTGEPFMGGGIYWMPRDFLKLGQLMLNGGTWNGKQVISKQWAERSIAPLVEINDRQYGYLWWVVDYPYQGKKVRAFFAGGTGGQLVIGIPELDLVIGFWGGNYSDRVMYRSQDEFVPQFILPAVR